MVQQVAQPVFDKVGLVLRAHIECSQEVDFSVTCVGHVVFEELIHLAGLNHCPELV